MIIVHLRMTQNRYYAIEHPLIGEAILEYDCKSRTMLDLTHRITATLMDNNETLLFRIEPSNYKPLPGEDMPTLAKLMVHNKRLVPFEKSNQFGMAEIDEKKAREIVKSYD